MMLQKKVMTQADCQQLIRQDMGLDMTKRAIQRAYATAKTIVLNEQDQNSISAYDKIRYGEFLEFIARISETWFEGTEMEDIPTYRKIEYFLERALLLVEKTLVHQEVVIEEFSDSDDDY